MAEYLQKEKNCMISAIVFNQTVKFPCRIPNVDHVGQFDDAGPIQAKFIIQIGNFEETFVFGFTAYPNKNPIGSGVFERD
jgi:hypothetical protein